MEENRPITREQIAEACTAVRSLRPRMTADEAARLAIGLFVARPEGNHCAPAVAMALQEAYDLPGGDLVGWVAGGFRGGVCTGEICGALSGAAIALSLMAYMVLPHSGHDRRVASSAVTPLIVELSRAFTARFGSVRCYPLTGRDRMSAEERARFSREREWEKTCGPFVEFAVRAVFPGGEAGL